MFKNRILLSTFAIFLFHFCAEARLYADNIAMPAFRRDSCWTFIDRIHLEPGHMSVNAQIKLALGNPKGGAVYNLQLVAIPESIWQKSLEVKCN